MTQNQRTPPESMETRGLFTPNTPSETTEYSTLLGPVAQVVVKETAKAMGFSKDEYDNRITADVITTARDTLFASLLEVSLGSRSEFKDVQENTDYKVIELGSEHVDNVVWHTAPITNTIIAATYQDKPDAAVATLQRQAYGRIYQSYLTP